jgi:hypothetical protein
LYSLKKYFQIKNKKEEIVNTKKMFAKFFNSSSILHERKKQNERNDFNKVVLLKYRKLLRLMKRRDTDKNPGLVIPECLNRESNCHQCTEMKNAKSLSQKMSRLSATNVTQLTPPFVLITKEGFF